MESMWNSHSLNDQLKLGALTDDLNLPSHPLSSQSYDYTKNHAFTLVRILTTLSLGVMTGSKMDHK